MPSQSFRAGVVIVVRHPDLRQVLAFGAPTSPDSWQLPQGGLDVGEEPVEGAWRELFEETGLDERHVVARAEYPEWVVYEWPPEIAASRRATAAAARTAAGSARCSGGSCSTRSTATSSPRPDGSEFVAWQWVEPPTG